MKNSQINRFNNIEFNQYGIEYLKDFQVIAENAYLRQKFLSKNDAQKNKEIAQSYYFISTPHPIGNISAPSLLLFDLSRQINNLKIRILANEENNIANNLSKIQQYLIIAKEILQNSLANFNDNSDQEYSSIVDFATSIINKSISIIENKDSKIKSLEDFNIITKNICQDLFSGVIEIGISNKVIKSNVQDAQGVIKNSILSNVLSKNDGKYLKSWYGVDADGDPDNVVSGIIPQQCNNKNIVEIFSICKKENLSKKLYYNFYYEPRISCKAGKKGVSGLVEQLEKISGINQINCFKDINNNELKELFCQFLENTKFESNNINHPLDTILRTCLPAFVNASGIVLSDFPANNNKIIWQLVAIIKNSEEFLSKKLKQNIVINQTILPLCETEIAVKGAEKNFANFLKEIDNEYNLISSAKIELEEQNKLFNQLRKFVVNEDNQFILGNFSGPSDLTKDVGSMSIAMINNLSFNITKLFRDFVASHPLLKLDNVDLIQEYGQGTSTKRDNNSVFANFDGSTIQGSNIISVNYQSAKAIIQSAKSIIANNKKLRKNYKEDDFVAIDENFQNLAIKAHRYFLGDDDGLITQQFNDKITDKAMQVINRCYSNNQGTRGSDGVVKYSDQRAINASFTTAYLGLLQHCGFPLPEDLELINNQNIDLFNSKLFFNIMVKELYQIANFNPERAKRLNFNDDLIKESNNYCNGVLKFLIGKVLNKEIADSKNFSDFFKSQSINQKLDFLVNNLIAGTDNHKNLQQHNLILREFKDQIPLIRKNQENLNSILLESLLKQDAIDYNQDYFFANIALLVNGITNFPLPQIAITNNNSLQQYKVIKPKNKIEDFYFTKFHNEKKELIK